VQKAYETLLKKDEPLARQSVMVLKDPARTKGWGGLLDQLVRSLVKERVTGNIERDWISYRTYWVSAGFSGKYADRRWHAALRGEDPAARPIVKKGQSPCVVMSKCPENNERDQLVRMLKGMPTQVSVPNAVAALTDESPLTLPPVAGASAASSFGMGTTAVFEPAPPDEAPRPDAPGQYFEENIDGEEDPESETQEHPDLCVDDYEAEEPPELVEPLPLPAPPPRVDTRKLCRRVLPASFDGGHSQRQALQLTGPPSGACDSAVVAVSAVPSATEQPCEPPKKRARADARQATPKKLEEWESRAATLRLSLGKRTTLMDPVDLGIVIEEWTQWAFVQTQLFKVIVLINSIRK
jgi:hypothetical protein